MSRKTARHGAPGRRKLPLLELLKLPLLAKEARSGAPGEFISWSAGRRPFDKLRAGFRWADEGVRHYTISVLGLGFGGEVVADAADGVALGIVQGEEFEAIAETLDVTNDGANLDGVGRKG